MSISETAHLRVDLDEAARQLAQAAHDAQVACDSISLGDLDWAHTNAIIARAASAPGRRRRARPARRPR